MYKVVPEENNVIRVHNTKNGNLLFSFMNGSDLSPTKQLIAYAYDVEKNNNGYVPSTDDSSITSKSQSSQYLKNKFEQNHFYSCHLCNDTFPSYSVLKNHKIYCTASIEADTDPEVAKYPWNVQKDSSTSESPDDDDPKCDNNLIAKDQILFLQSFNLSERGESKKQAKKSFRGLISNGNFGTAQGHYSSKNYYSLNSKEHSVAFSSPLGKIVTKYLPVPHHMGDQLDQHWQMPKMPLWYEQFCGRRVISKQTIPYLRDRSNLPTKSVFAGSTKAVRSRHVYTFTKQQRISRYRFLSTGLTKEGRRLKRLCKKCSVNVERLPEKLVKKYEKVNSQYEEYKNLMSLKDNSSPEIIRMTPPKVKKKTKSLKKKKKKQITLKLHSGIVLLNDISKELCLNQYGIIHICGTNITVDRRNFQKKFDNFLKCALKCSCSKYGNISSSLQGAKNRFVKVNSSIFKPEPEVIDITSDDDDVSLLMSSHNSNRTSALSHSYSDDEITISKRLEESLQNYKNCSVQFPNISPHKSFNTKSVEDKYYASNTACYYNPIVAKPGSHSYEGGYIAAKNDDSDNEISVSKRMEKSIEIFTNCSVRLADLSFGENFSIDNSSNNDLHLTGHQPTTHLFKCHACQDVEQLYRQRASLHIQQHMSIIHNISITEMFHHLVEHQQDFGSYFVVVVEAFPNLSSSPSKYQSKKNFIQDNFKSNLGENL